MHDQERTKQQLIDDLERRVEERTVELRGANERLRAEIDERRLAEAALRDSEQRLHSICDSALDAVILLDSDGKPVYWNPAAERMFGYTLEEVAGKDVHAMLATDAHREQAIHAVREFASTGRGAAIGKVVQLTARRKDGGEFPIELALSAFTIDQRWCAAAIIRDVTQRRQTEEALQQERTTLEHLLQSSDHERQMIAYEIHDGLAQLLAGAIMQFQAFAHLRDTQPADAAGMFEAGAAMLQQAHFEARRLISGVRPPILDEEGVVAAISHLINEQHRNGGPLIEFHGDAHIARLTPVLENAVYRIAQETLTNACRHSHSGRVRIELMQRDERIRLEVRDWGQGFRPNAVEHGRFGLAGVRQRARLMGGTATVESQLGEGTRITVDLPAVFRKGQ